MLSAPLNNDILLSILSVSPPKTATSIMATCSFLYHEGAKIVLQDPVELFGSEEEALALLRFIQAEDLSRCSYVRTLHITTVPESVAQILADLVPRMTGLKRLSLAGAEQIFESHPHLLPIFASLRSLKTLVIAYVGERSSEMLRTLQSELVFACLHFPPIEPLDLPLAAASHPILMLKRSASTLEELSCSCLVGTNPELTLSPPKVIYSKLRTLNLYQKFPPNAISFIKAFSNLASSHVVNTLTRRDGAIESYRFERELNLEAQRPPKDGQPSRWKHLQVFTGHPVDLWVLGLTCRIPQLTLEDAPTAHSPFVLTDVLAYARPARLTITFENHPLTGVLGGGFLTALRSDGASGLRSLAFVIDLMVGDRNLDVGRALTDLESALSGLQLRDLLFAMRDIGLSENTGAPSASPAEPHRAHTSSQSTPSSPTQASASACSNSNSAGSRPSLSLAERTLNDFDAPAFVCRLVASIPTMQNMMVVIERPGQCGGRLRIGYLAKCEERSVGPMYTGGDLVYQETIGPNYDRASFAGIIKGWNTHMPPAM